MPRMPDNIWPTPERMGYALRAAAFVDVRLACGNLDASAEIVGVARRFVREMHYRHHGSIFRHCQRYILGSHGCRCVRLCQLGAVSSSGTTGGVVNDFIRPRLEFSSKGCAKQGATNTRPAPSMLRSWPARANIDPPKPPCMQPAGRLATRASPSIKMMPAKFRFERIAQEFKPGHANHFRRLTDTLQLGRVVFQRFHRTTDRRCAVAIAPIHPQSRGSLRKFLRISEKTG